jgi:hypothetical protein
MFLATVATAIFCWSWPEGGTRIDTQFHLLWGLVVTGQFAFGLAAGRPSTHADANRPLAWHLTTQLGRVSTGIWLAFVAGLTVAKLLGVDGPETPSSMLRLLGLPIGMWFAVALIGNLGSLLLHGAPRDAMMLAYRASALGNSLVPFAWLCVSLALRPNG